MVVQGDHIQATKTIFVKKKIFPSILAIFCPILGHFGSIWVVLGQGGTGGSKNEHKIRKKIDADPMTASPGPRWAVLSACQTLGHENDV